MLMAVPTTQPLVKEVSATMRKLENLAERQKRKFEKEKAGRFGWLGPKRW